MRYGVFFLGEDGTYNDHGHHTYAGSNICDNFPTSFLCHVHHVDSLDLFLVDVTLLDVFHATHPVNQHTPSRYMTC